MISEFRSSDRSPLRPGEAEAHRAIFDLVLAALVRREGGMLRLPASEVAPVAGDGLRLGFDRDTGEVVIKLEKVPS